MKFWVIFRKNLSFNIKISKSCKDGYTLIMKRHKMTAKYEKIRSVLSMSGAFHKASSSHFIFMPFRSRWWFFGETSKVSYRVWCKSALIHTLESKFHENDEKCVKECFTFHFFFSWNTLKCEVKYEIWSV